MLLHEIATAVEDVAATSSRLAKTGRVAAVLRRCVEDSPADLPVAVRYLEGELTQRRTGLGWRSLADRPAPAATASLTVAEVDSAFEQAQLAAGAGSTGRRRELLHGLLARATAPEQHLLAGLVTGELRQGAQRGVLLEAVAAASGAAPAAVRRGVTLTGDVVEVAVAALLEGPQALARFGLEVGRALAPMLAASAPSLPDALAKTGPAGVDWKLDGIRVQLHKQADGTVRVFTRSLDDVTARVPEVVAAVRALPAREVVLDGELLALDGPDLTTARPLPFQRTAARLATHEGHPTPVSTVLFDVLHLDGTDLVDEPASARRAALERLAPALAVPRVVADPADPTSVAAAEAFVADALARGHEGAVVKALDAPYAMGRRGAGWVKVKPRITLDLVVLAAEWGHGRRSGLLSNLHLGARDPDGRYGDAGGFVMLGKTFKGLTDAMLAWQTERLQALALPEQDGRHVVRVRPDLVVEIAFDGVQTSPRYPAGMALRFARVLRHRPDKRADEADTVATVAGFHQP